jgi:predicted AlkP superfamily phosphohydrolase/phosphomutase
MPLSSPPEYVRDLARDAGRFYTQEMPEDTKALAAGALDHDEFLAQSELVYQETLRLLDRELTRYQGGLLFFYFSSIDQLSHIFYGALHPDAPEELRRYAHVLPDLYQRVDQAIGEVLERAAASDREIEVVVMSDHGFAHYRRKVHLNSWLAQEGYLTLLDKPARGPLGHIDWENTQAYARGLNQLFLNLRGREAQGVVAPEQADTILRRIERELLTWRDEEGNARVVTRVERPPVGTFRDRAPDLLVGFNRGYRSSDESALGEVTDTVIEDNLASWSGDHCMDPALVPGVLFTTFGLSAERASLIDMAPTILGYFGVPVPKEMQGANLWDETRSRSRSR